MKNNPRKGYHRPIILGRVETAKDRFSTLHTENITSSCKPKPLSKVRTPS